jgi:hypothetical protein
MPDLLVAALQWDPHIRGALIVLTAFVILPGSVYLLLATNTGARLGLLLAVAGLTGWLFLMSLIWMVLGIGLKGRQNSWVAKEIITGEPSQSTIEAMADFPGGKWKELKVGDKALADAQAAADQVLAPVAETTSAHGESGQPAEPEFPPPFTAPDKYVHQHGYETGGDNELFTIGKHKFYFRHSPHYAVIQVQEALPKPEGDISKSVPDPSKPATTVVMLRDLGSVRFPPFVLMVCTGTIFLVTCYVLHQRDKELMRAKAETAAVA